jgi:hypothetical protein
MDLGECQKVHSDLFRQMYDSDKSAAKDFNHAYEYELEKYLETFAVDCDRKVQKNQRRLEEIQLQSYDVMEFMTCLTFPVRRHQSKPRNQRSNSKSGDVG